MPYRWMPISGDFDITDDQIVFHGKTIDLAPEPGGEGAPAKGSAIGILVSDQPAADGSITADVTFANVEEGPTCEFILAYRSDTKSMVTAGLGGGWGMFSIREWIPSIPNVGQSRW